MRILFIASIALVAAACSGAPAHSNPPAPSAALPSPPPSPSASAALPAPSAVPFNPSDVGLDADAVAVLSALRDAPVADSHAIAIVQSLTDEVGPRLGGSPGDRAAVAWAEKAMTANGLAHVHTEPAMITHWERGAEEGAIVAPLAERLVLTALGGSVATPEKGLEAEIIEVASLEAIAKLDRATVSGKIVFYNAIMEATHDGSGYGRVIRVRGAGAIEAAKLGAVGVVVRSLGTDHNRLPHTGAMGYADGVPKIPAAALAIPDAELLHRLLARGAVRIRMSLGAKSFPEVASADVVGDVIGSSAPEEIVLLGAHLDSWDLGTGAIDDAAGCGLMLDAGRRIAALPKHPRRTIRVVFFAGEENSGGGARAYAKGHEAELPHHVLAIEADFGAARVVETRLRGGPEGKAPFAAIAGLLAPIGVTASSERAFGGSDLEPLLPAGVPLLDLRQDGTHYFDIHHTANDTLDKIVIDDYAQASNAFVATAYAAAAMQPNFGRIPEDQRTPRKK